MTARDIRAAKTKVQVCPDCDVDVVKSKIKCNNTQVKCNCNKKEMTENNIPEGYAAVAEVEFRHRNGLVKMGLVNPMNEKLLKEGKLIMIVLNDGKEYVGVYGGRDGGDLVLKSTSSRNAMGLKFRWINHFLIEL
ncbi:MAG: hypothetical protein EP346_06895 [Bacteroidetes bacterium]|nr:MAG: hypothetical protein EP346_06895 [Bacteroidota bacterium]